MALIASAVAGVASAAIPVSPAAPAFKGRSYPVHTSIVATTFWVGEIFDPNAADGSQMTSTYDSRWYAHYGGCDGVNHGTAVKRCQTERRNAANGFFPVHMVPKQNPFYLDLPYDDLNDSIAFRERAAVIPWAHDPGYAGHARDPNFSYMKNRWVQLRRHGRTCYGQIEDAGPGDYHDAKYVFGSHNARPANRRYGWAGLDVSPALNGCLAFSELNGESDRVSWRFVDAVDVPPGPWKRLVTTRGVDNR